MYGEQHEDRKIMNPETEAANLEKDISSLHHQAEDFQQRLRSKLQDPNLTGLQRVAATLVSRLETQEAFGEVLGGMQQESRELHARLQELSADDTEYPGLQVRIPQLVQAHAQAGRLLTMSEWHMAARKKKGDGESVPVEVRGADA